VNARQRAEIWDDVWAEYDARQIARSLAPTSDRRRAIPPMRATVQASINSIPSFAAVAAPRRLAVRPWRAVATALTGGLVLLGLWLSMPWLLALRLSVPLGQGDAPGLLRHFDAPVAMVSLRDGLRAEIVAEEGTGARRFLSGMADRMAASWERPESVSAWLAVRVRGGRGEGSPVALSNLRSARPVGLAAFRLEYGPAGEEGGVAFDLSWQGDGFRVTAMRFLDVPVAPPSSTMVAMR